MLKLAPDWTKFMSVCTHISTTIIMSLNINMYQELIDLTNKSSFRTFLGVNLTFLSLNEEFFDFLFGLGEGRVLLYGFLDPVTHSWWMWYFQIFKLNIWISVCFVAKCRERTMLPEIRWCQNDDFLGLLSYLRGSYGLSVWRAYILQLLKSSFRS